MARHIRFVFLGRIDINHKGIDILLDALKQLQEKVSKNLYSVNFYGYGEDKDILELKYRLSKFEENIKYMGPVWGEAKNNVFSSSDILLLTSRYEGMPMGILEALSFGCLCLITPQTNFGDIIKKNACGWVVPLKSTEIASVMKNIIYSNKEHWTKMMNNAQKVANMFAWDEVAKLSIQMYQKVL